jgi:hypothetical protein
MKSRARPFFLSFATLFLICFGFSFWHAYHLISDELMYPQWNRYFLVISGMACLSALILFFISTQRATFAVAVTAVVLVHFAMRPFSEVDQLFYQHLAEIRGDQVSSGLPEKIELCDYVKSSYVNLKKKMLIHLEETCSHKIMEISQRSSRELNQAFDWAYSEYARKPQSVQAEALVCLYAETNQSEFALEISQKHQFNDLTARLKTEGRCREFKNKRQIASVEK